MRGIGQVKNTKYSFLLAKPNIMGSAIGRGRGPARDVSPRGDERPSSRSTQIANYKSKHRRDEGVRRLCYTHAASEHPILGSEVSRKGASRGHGHVSALSPTYDIEALE